MGALSPLLAVAPAPAARSVCVAAKACKMLAGAGVRCALLCTFPCSAPSEAISDMSTSASVDGRKRFTMLLFLPVPGVDSNAASVVHSCKTHHPISMSILPKPQKGTDDQARDDQAIAQIWPRPYICFVYPPYATLTLTTRSGVPCWRRAIGRYGQV